MTKIEDVRCVLLAAGVGRRFGSNKLLHLLPNGKTLLANSLAIYAQIFAETVVVVNQESRDIAHVLSITSLFEVDHVASADTESGLSQSLVAGIKSAIPKKGWLIALADMPYVQPETIYAMCSALNVDNIVVPKSDLGIGNPVAFGLDFRPQLLPLKGDAGAKSVLRSNPQAVIELSVGDFGIHHDIDQPHDIKMTRT